MQVNLSQYDAIIFDLGGVILDIDPERTWNMFAKYTDKKSIQKILESGWLQEFEKGKIQHKELRDKINGLLGTQIAEDPFIRAWNAMLIDYKPKRIERIQWLKKTHRLFLLSNTNELHFNYFENKLIKEYGVSFDDIFNFTYVSHKMGLVKPDAQIFRQVLIEQQLNPETTLFIEDTRENAESASKLGIQTLVIPRNGNFYDYLR
jgi:epoxide hydrolase-like predicted phosphatase